MQTTELITYYPIQQHISYCELELLRDALWEIQYVTWQSKPAGQPQI